MSKNFHGFRRSKQEFINILKKNSFKIISVYEDDYLAEYNRLRTVKKLKIGKLISYFFFRSHPYLHIFHLRKIS